MGINSNNNGTNQRTENRGQKKETPIERVVSETKRKVHNVQSGKK